MGRVMTRRGFFRAEVAGIGECARVSAAAGDAGPYLEREMYELLQFNPPFERLPSREEFEAQRGWRG